MLEEPKASAAACESHRQRPWHNALSWIGAPEPALLIALASVAFCVWSFVEVAEYVLDGDSQALDERILLAMRSDMDPGDPLGPSWVEELARDVTALGGTANITFLTLAAAGFLLLQRKSHLALYLVLAIGSGTALSLLMKMTFDRPRPTLVAHGQAVYTSSFPSGHSMMSALTFLTIAALLAGTQKRWSLKVYLMSLAVLLALSVGTSRVYLGVHWPTDVLAGWSAGAAWALVCWSIAEHLRRRGGVE